MAGVYLSYPFCTQKCTFCNFASGVVSEAKQRRYEDFLVQEIARHKWEWAPETVYWGGGTPSLMPLERFREAMRQIPFSRVVESTIECAPGTITSERARAWRQCGINRVSLGVQSLVAAEARRTGRKHTAETVREDMDLLRREGFSNINIDLIAGLPGQTRNSWNESLDHVAALSPTHVSVYLFEIDEDSALGHEALIGGIRYGAQILPDDEAAAEFYQTAVERLRTIGLERYEISNFAAKGFESRHNLKYWRLEPYVGFGVDAHSFDGTRRWSNADDLDEYLSHDGQKVSAESERSDLEQEHFFIGLRQMHGIEPTNREWSRFARPIQQGIQAGVLERDGARLRLTDRGVLVSNEIFQEFLI